MKSIFSLDYTDNIPFTAQWSFSPYHICLRGAMEHSHRLFIELLLSRTLSFSFFEIFSLFVFISFTAVTLQFVSHSFLDYHDPTIGKLLVRLSLNLEGKRTIITFISICRRFISTASDYRWRTCTSWHSRYCGSGWVHCNARPVYEMWRGFHNLLFYLWPA